MFIVCATEGQSMTVGDRVLTVDTTVAPGVVRCHLDGEADPVLIFWDRKTELLPGVMVSVERNLGFALRNKFLFQAPRSIRIRELPHGDHAANPGEQAGRTARESLRPVE